MTAATGGPGAAPRPTLLTVLAAISIALGAVATSINLGVAVMVQLLPGPPPADGAPAA